MKLVTIEELEAVTRSWIRESVSGITVQLWHSYEQRLADYFLVARSKLTHHEVMHQVMAIACAVAHGSTAIVKECLRAAGPAAVDLASELFGHLPNAAAVLQAETRFRAGDLACDWTIHTDSSGKAVVRTEFVKQESKH